MPSKYQIISELAAQGAREITSGADRYMDFLTTAANNYKYSFKEQLLIHAQKPDATACAEIGMWNRLGRWVNKGTKGIALLVDTDSRYKLRYVFDISDTNSRYGIEVTLWHLQERFQEHVIEALENSFGELEEHSNFPNDLIAIADSVVEDNLADYLAMLQNVKEGSLLEELDELNLKAWLKDSVQSSVAFMTLTRCGFNAKEYIFPEDLSHVYDFNTPDTIAVLGGATSDIAEMALREVEATVRAAEREEKNANRTFANSPGFYDTVGRKSERSDDHGTDIQERGRLSSAQRDSAGEPEDREVRDASTRLSEEPSGSDLHGNASEWEAENPFGGDRPAGDRNDGTPGHGDGKEGGRDREPEGIEPDAVGEPDEQHPGESRGDGPDRPDLRIEDDAAKEEIPEAASFLQESGHDFNARTDIPYYHYDAEKQELIRISDALKDHRKAIAAYFADHEDRKERGNYIKTFFDNTFVEKILSDGKRAGYRAYDDLLTLWRGSYLGREMEVFMRWESVASTIYGMILMDQWLERDERPLPTEGEQIALIAEAQAEQKDNFTLPQAAIDYVLAGGSGVSEGKFRIYEQFQRGESAEDNIKFLKNEYGIGGHSDAIPGTGIWEDHDGKGITLTRSFRSGEPKETVVLKWPQVEKRIRELIAVDRYLNRAEKESYPDYLHRQEVRAERGRIARSFEEITQGFSTYMQDMGKEDPFPSRWYLLSCGNAFKIGDKKMYARHAEGDFILPMMREALTTVIAEGDTPYLKQAESILAELSGPLAMGLEPTEEELNPPPPPKKEYRFEAGNIVWIGAKECEIVFLGTEKVLISDVNFPLIQEEYSRQDFDRMVSENPMNDRYLQVVQTPDLLEEAKKLINEYCLEEFESEADFSDLTKIGLAYTTTEDEDIPVEAEADLVTFCINRYVNSRLVEQRQYSSLESMIQKELKYLDFNELVDFTDEQIDLGRDEEETEEPHQQGGNIQSGSEDMAAQRTQYAADAHEEEYEHIELFGQPMLFTTSRIDRETVPDGWHCYDLRGSDYDPAEPIMVENRVVVNHAGTILSPTDLELERYEDNRRRIGNELTFLDEIVTLEQFCEEHGYSLDQKPVEGEKELAPPPPAAKPKEKITPTILYPEISSEHRLNYQIKDDTIGAGTPLERYYHNVRAIQLLKKLEDEHRLATPTEQNILSEYVGWGGLADCFDEKNSHYLELKSLLTEDEYAAARESTLTAFYTPPVVIRSMYQALENMGFQRGNILEPSCGIGNFLGMKPDSLSDSKIYGIELDSISGRIARQLYQTSSVAVQGFEKTELPDSFFDVAIGNVPFGDFKLGDKRYDKYNFLIHDYFFARTLDKVRPGGIIAFVTSKGTLDKTNPNVRKYIAQRADLLGAIRLPNDTFKSAAGTEVTSDIIFLQKRDTLTAAEPDWVHLGTDKKGITMNQYFVDNPDMVLGEMKEISGPFGPETACIPYEDQNLGELLSEAIQNITGSIKEYDLEELAEEEEDKSIPADPSVRNFSYTLLDGNLYYRENSRMVPVEVSVTGANRIKGLIGIRDCVRQLIEYQTEDYPDEMIEAEQKKLNELYDSFAAKYGIINSRANKSVFNTDNSFFLLSSLEVLDDEGNFVRKADMFSKRTIKQRADITRVDTAAEALAISLAEKAKVDMPYMMDLTGKDEPEIYEDLKGVVFLNPMYGYGNDTEEKYLTADEYLSGNVREKLQWARKSAELNPEDYTVNVTALEQVQPVDLTAAEISVRIGATWIPPEDYAKFMFELFDTPWWSSRNIKIHYSAFTGEWNIEGKTYDRSNVKANNTYGTDRINGYRIMEQTLNLKDVRIFDYVEDENGNKKPVLNKKETAIAQAKQEQIKQAFQEWIWRDQERRERLCRLYNDKFNSVRPREYDGSHLALSGINPEITLRQHQLNAVARGLYGGNELLGHVVGAGKTFTMVAIAQESKRLGLCQKSLIVVPNHLTEQWAADYLQLYPSANILVATAKDFETKNRKRFCGRIATGDYDAVIIGHSQLEKIPLSFGRQCYYLEQQRQEIMDGIIELKANRGDRFSVKQLEKEKKRIDVKLEKLNDQSRKDDIVTFEELGIDRLFIDEAHYYKNLAAFTKMRNVGGISQTEAQKSSDLYMKIRYLDELTGGRGVCFATGTPISNTMVEMYTMQKYLQYDTLKRNDLIHFDSWASTFGETVTAIELAPEGTGYRAKTRFAKFYNLPELMAMFKECADIQTADMLNLPVPKAVYHTVALKPSEYQKQMVEELAKRAERVRSGMVNSSVDNMLVITNDGRKLALDQRLINPMLPDSETGKVAVCAKNVFEIWQKTADKRSTQMIFCDLSTPHGNGEFNVYDALRDKLLSLGIPAEEIAYIHSAGTEVKKKELFGKVRSGLIRVLIGSTQKMGAGTNVQKKLIAEHHLDCPWRPADLQQREGRIIRQGNENPEVEIYTYVTENTFDAYLYQLVESKQKFIGQIMTSKSPVRSAEDIDETALSYAEIKALCSGNPKIKEKMDLDVAVAKLKLIKANHLSQIYSLESDITHRYPKQITECSEIIEGLQKDMALREEQTLPNEDGFSPMVIVGRTYTEKKAAGSAILEACKAMTSPDAVPLGQYRGFSMELFFDSFSKEYRITMTGSLKHTVSLGMDIFGNIQRMDNVLDGMGTRLEDQKQKLEHTKEQLEIAKEEVKRPFPQEAELKEKQARLDELNIELNMDKPENEVVDSDREEDEPSGQSTKELEVMDHDR